MKWVADESVDSLIVRELRTLGHSVRYVCEESPGQSDEDVLRAALRDSAVLLTADKDFGELVFGQRRVARGVLPLRLTGLASNARANLVSRIVQERGADLEFAYTVLMPGRLRIRRHGPPAP